MNEARVTVFSACNDENLGIRTGNEATLADPGIINHTTWLYMYVCFGCGRLSGFKFSFVTVIFRNKAYDSNLRYKRTLSILHQLFLLCHGGKLPEESVMKIFPLLMPDWLDLLVKLRSEPGRMDKLQEQFK